MTVYTTNTTVMTDLVLKIQNQTWWHLLKDVDILYSQKLLPREDFAASYC